MSGEDFVVTTGIDTTAAKRGEEAFIASLNAIEQAATKFKKDFAGLFDPFLASVTNVKQQLASLTASFEAVKAAPIKAIVADFNSLTVSVERAAVAANGFSLAGITTQATAARTAMLELEAAMRATSARRPTSTGTTGPVTAAAPAGNNLGSEITAASLSSIIAVADAFGPAASKIQTAVAAMAESLNVAAISSRNFSVASVSVRTALAKMQEAATTAVSPVTELAAVMSGLNIKFTGLQKAASDLLTLSTAANSISASSGGLAQFATGITSIREAVSRMNLANATKQLEALQASLANSAVLDRAAASFDKLASSMASIGTIGATAFETLAARIASVTAQVNQFVTGMNAVRVDVFKAIADDVGNIGTHLTTATNGLSSFTAAGDKIGPALATMAQNIKSIDFTAFAKSAADALKPIAAMADQLDRMSKSVNTVVNDFARLNVNVQNVYRNASNAISAASQAQSLPQARATGNSGAGLSGFATAQFRQGLKDLHDAASQVAASLAHMGDMATNASGRFSTFSQIAGGVRSNLQNLRTAAVDATTGVARLMASFVARTITTATSALASFGSTLGHVVTAMLGFQGLQSITNVFSPHAIVETANAWTNLSKRIQSVAHSQSEATAMLAATTDLAQTFRMPLEEVTRTFTKLYEIQHPLGASLTQIKEELGGVLSSMARVGATTADFNSTMTAFTNLVATGTLTLTQMRSLFAHDPLLLEQVSTALGKTGNQIRINLQKVGEVSKATGAQVAGAIANIYKAGQGSFDAIPRSVADALQQIKNQWLLTIGEIQKNTGFVDTITAALDKFRAALAGPNMQAAISNIIQFGTLVTTSMIEWTASIGSVPALFEKISVAVSNLGSIVANWSWDRITGDSSLKRLLDALNGPITAKQSLKDQSAFGDDPAKAGATRVKEGLDKLADGYTFHVKTEFATPEAKASLQGFLDQTVAAGRTAAQSLAVALGNGVRITPEGLASFDQGIAKLQLMQQQVRTNKISDQLKEDLGNSVEVVRSQLTAASSLISGEINSTRFDIASLQAKLLELPPAWTGLSVETQKVTEQLTAAKDRAAALTESALNTAAAMKALGNSDLSPLIAQLRTAAAISVDPNNKIPIGANLKSTKADHSGNSGQDKIATLKEQINLLNAELSGDVALVANAKERLALEKLVTQAMKDGHPEQVKILTDLEHQRFALEKNLQWAKEFQSIGQQFGQSLENNFLAVASGTMKFDQALKQSLATMIKLVAEALIIKPLINQLSANFGQIGQSIGAATGGYASQGLLGGLGGGGATAQLTAAATAFNTTVATGATTVATSLEAMATSVSATLNAAFTTASASFETLTSTAGTTFATTIQTAAASFAATVQSASLAGGGGIGGGLGGGLFNGLALANGGAFDGMSQPIKYFANGDIFDQPTAFSYGGGQLGVMGEAGPEAVMSLQRGADGKLGVRANGTGGVTHNSHVTINIAGDLTEATQRDIMAQMHQIVSERTPGIVNHATTNVQRQNKRNPSFLRR